MPREIKTLDWCDRCAQDDQWVEAREMPPITIGQKKARILLLCEMHEKELITPLDELLTDMGQIVDTPARGMQAPRTYRSGSYPCPVPDCVKHDNPFGHEQSLRGHARKMHDATIGELVTEHGRPEGAADVPIFAAPDEVYPCPECERKFNKASALGRHRLAKHGVASAKAKAN